MQGNHWIWPDQVAVSPLSAPVGLSRTRLDSLLFEVLGLVRLDAPGFGSGVLMTH